MQKTSDPKKLSGFICDLADALNPPLALFEESDATFLMLAVDKNVPLEKLKDDDELEAIALRYEIGACDCKEDLTSAFNYYKTAAEEDSTFAQLRLSNLYYAKRIPSEDHIADFLNYCSRACENDCAQAYFNLANYYASIDDYDKAVDLYESACNLNLVEACVELGELFFEGEKVKENKDKALELFEKSHKLGYPGALYMMAECYLTGGESIQNLNKGIEILKRLANNREVPALYRLGECYLEGLGVKQDYAQARKWLEKATAAHHIDAPFALVPLLIEGKGGKVDIPHAIKILKPLAKDDPEALELLNKIQE